MPFLGHRDDTFSPEIPASCSKHRTHGAKPHVHACACPAPPNSTKTVNYMFEMLDAAEVICNGSTHSAALLRPDPVDRECDWLRANPSPPAFGPQILLRGSLHRF